MDNLQILYAIEDINTDMDSSLEQLICNGNDWINELIGYQELSWFRFHWTVKRNNRAFNKNQLNLTNEIYQLMLYSLVSDIDDVLKPDIEQSKFDASVLSILNLLFKAKKILPTTVGDMLRRNAPNIKKIFTTIQTRY